MFAPAWDTLWRLVSELEDILSWLQVGINKRNCRKLGGNTVLEQTVTKSQNGLGWKGALKPIWFPTAGMGRNTFL